MRRFKIIVGAGAAVAVALAAPSAAAASRVLTEVSSDAFTNTTSQHNTQVEPDTFASGSTIVSAFQSGRFTDGGSSDIGWSTSTNNGVSWTHGFLPGITIYTPTGAPPGFTTGPFQRVSDPSVAYDAAHGTWLISSLALNGTDGVATLVSHSTDGGLTWSAPVSVSGASTGLDKDWIVCDSTQSTFRGHCYVEWDDNGHGNLIQMSTSIDGGQTWGGAQTTADRANGLGGQPVVQPNGTVVVPIANANETAILSYESLNGGTSWGTTTVVSPVKAHRVSGSLRSEPLPSAEVDGGGVVYVVWQDCRFESTCRSNDIVLSSSATGTQWSAVTRVPIDAIGSGVDHFIPGLAVDPSTAGGSAHLALAYYYYPVAACSTSNCQLDVGFVSSGNGGSSWSSKVRLAGPMALTWLPSTTQGYMVGDYMSTSFAGGTAHPVFAVAQRPASGRLNEAMFSPSTGLVVR